MSELTQEEKIDYIYKILKTNEKRRKIWLIIKWGIRIIILLFLLYMYFFGFAMIMNNIKAEVKDFFKWNPEKINKIKKDVIKSISETANDLTDYYKKKK